MPQRLPAAAIAVMLLAAGCSRDPVKASRAYIASGDRYAKQGKFKEAAIEYRNAIKLTPDSADAHAKLADAAAAAHDSATAFSELIRVAELRPTDVAAQVRASSVFLLAGRFADAKAHGQTAVRFGRDNADAHVVLGEALAGLRDIGESEQQLREAVRLAPGSIDARLALGSLLWSTNRAKDAEAEFRRAIESAPDDPGANRALALFDMVTGRAAEAEPLWRAVAVSPNGDPMTLVDYFTSQGRLRDAERELNGLTDKPAVGETARLRLAAVQFALGNHAAGYDTLHDILAREPRSVPALLLRARFLFDDHKVDEALAVAESAQSADPSSADAAFLDGQLLVAKGSLERAVQAFQRTMKLNPRAGAAAEAIARIRLQGGHADEAVEWAMRAREAQPRDPAAQLMVAMFLEAAHRPAEARREYEGILARDPRAAIAANNLAWLNLQDGRLDDALKEALVAKAELDRAPEVNDTLGWVYYQRHQPTLAIPLLEQSVTARPENALYRSHLDTAQTITDKHVRGSNKEAR